MLVFAPPVALAILQGAQKLGLQNKVIWTCATPCNTDFLATALRIGIGAHKLYVNAEMNLVAQDGGPHAAVQQVLKLYGSNVAGGVGSFSQFGFVLR